MNTVYTVYTMYTAYCTHMSQLHDVQTEHVLANLPYQTDLALLIVVTPQIKTTISECY